MHRRILVLGASAALATAAFAGAASAQEAVDPPHPVHIHAGVCPEPGDVVRPLADLVIGTNDPVGVAAALQAEASRNTVDMSLADMLAAEHSINAHQSADEMALYIACGDIGGQMLGDSDLVIGLAEQNGSGHVGVAFLHDNGDGSTQVDVYLVSLSGTSPGGSPAPAESPAVSAPAESPAMSAPAESPATSAPAASAPVASEPAASPAAS